MLDANSQILVYQVSSEVINGETVTTNGIPVKVTLAELKVALAAIA